MDCHQIRKKKYLKKKSTENFQFLRLKNDIYITWTCIRNGFRDLIADFIGLRPILDILEVLNWIYTYIETKQTSPHLEFENVKLLKR